MSDVIDLAVMLTECDVTCEFQHVPSSYDPKSKDWQGICWRVTIRTPRGEFSTDYKEGIGHLPQNWGFSIPPRSVDDLTAMRQVLLHGRRFNTVTGNLRPERLPVPKSESVLSCLFSDAQAGEDEFSEFCANCGYDEDSRKAEAVWRACRDTAANLHRLFTGEQFDRLAEALREV